MNQQKDPAWRFASTKQFHSNLQLSPSTMASASSIASFSESFLGSARIPRVRLSSSLVSEDLQNLVSAKSLHLERWTPSSEWLASRKETGFLESLALKNLNEAFLVQIPAATSDLNFGMLIESLSRNTDNPYRTVVLEIGAGSHVNLIQEFVGDAGATPMNVYISLAAGAHLNHILISPSLSSSSIYQTIHCQVAQEARYEWRSIVNAPITGRTFHQEVSVSLNGAKASCSLQSVSLSEATNSFESFVRCIHNVGDTKSEQLYKVALGDSSKSFFRGEIQIEEGADLSSSTQLSQALLLSKSAQSITEPVLRISADDVEAAHGSTSGALNAEELFYLESRGIDPSEAQKMIVSGFLLDVVDQVQLDSLKAWARKEILR